MRRSAFFVCVFAVAAVVAAAMTGPIAVEHRLAEIVSYVREAGMPGIAVFGLAYVLSAVVLVPGAVLTLGAGVAYGPAMGVIIVSPVSVIAASVAFLLGRYAAREWVRRRIAQDRRFAAIDDAIGAHGFRVVVLLRLSPLFPFTMLNYVLALSKVSFRAYVLGSWLGMLPVTVLYVYLGSLLTSVGDLRSGERADGAGASQALYWAGLGATILVTVVLTRAARRALSASLAAHDDAEASTQPPESR